MDWKEKQKQLREEAILENARDLLSAQGYAAMNMDELANLVGVSKATLYQHFSSKEELAVQVCLHGMKKGEAHMMEIDSTLSAIARLEAMLRKGLKKRAHVAELRYNMRLPGSIYEDPRIKAHQKRMKDMISDLIEQGKAQGDILETHPTPVIRQMIMSFFGPFYEELLQQRVCTPDELSDALLSIFLNGIKNPTKPTVA